MIKEGENLHSGKLSAMCPQAAMGLGDAHENSRLKRSGNLVRAAADASYMRTLQ